LGHTLLELRFHSLVGEGDGLLIGSNIVPNCHKKFKDLSLPHHTLTERLLQ